MSVSRIMKPVILLWVTAFIAMPGVASVHVSECMADNDNTLLDVDGDSSDWIELYNDSTNAVDLTGWYLADTVTNLTQWMLPSVTIPGKGFLIVFASDKERSVTGSELHTNFKLSASGEAVVLTGPDGITIESQLTFPAQQEDISWGYGFSGGTITSRTTLVEFGSPCTAHIPTSSSDSIDWKQTGFDDSGWLSGTTGVGFERSSGYEFLIGLDVEAMYDANASVYMRIPFVYDTSHRADLLSLGMQFDDGFVAYLNSTLVASFNAPITPTWYSTATDSHADADARSFFWFDLSAYEGALQNGTNVLSIHGFNETTTSADLLFVPKLITASITSTESRIELAGTGLLEAPTPGGPNTGVTYIGYCDPPTLGPERGFYDAPFQVSMTNVSEGASLRYTTDGSAPTAFNGTPYSGPITIDGTTLLRAAAVREGYRPSVPNTQTYLFVDEVLQQDGSGLQPYADWGDGGPDWEVDPTMTHSLVTDFEGQSFSLTDALLDVPSVSLVTDWDNWWSDEPGPPLATGLVPWQGIYVDRIAMHADRRPVSMEFFTADGSETFAENGRVSVIGGGIGGTSAVRWKSDKLSLRVAFDGKLNHPVFGDDAAQKFNGLVLDAHLAWCWTHSGRPYIGATPKFVSDALASDIQNSMGHGKGAPHSRFVHLYLNGLYWGMFDMHERPDEHFSAEYYGGTNEEYDSIKHLYDDTSEADSDFDGVPYNDNITGGDDANLHGMFALARADLSLPGNYDALAEVLDIDDLIDYLLMNFYLGNTDWAHKNWYATYNRNDPEGRWRYHSWDAEHIIETSLFNADLAGALAYDSTIKNNTGGPTEIHQNLTAGSAEYRLRFADQIQRHFFNDGILTIENTIATFWARVKEVDRAMLGEAARWADNKEYLGYGDYDYSNWYNHMVDLRDTYFPYRYDVVLNQLKTGGLYPDTAAPEFAVNRVPMHGGLVAATDSISIQSANTIYYTVDGTDPRAVGGAAVGIEYAVPLSFSQPTLLKARAKNGNEWSALCEAVFLSEDLPLVVTELMYHAQGSNSQDFIEIQNISDETVDLDGYKFDGAIDYSFGNSTTRSLAPGEFMVVIKDSGSFSATYSTNGILIAGEYKGDFDNGGEKVELEFWNKDLITFRYSDARNWPQAADGAGHSLVPLEAAMDSQESGSLDYGGNWRASSYLNGSPGYADPIPEATILLNEITAHTDTGEDPPFESNDQIELYNPTDSEVVLNGWYLSDDLDELNKWAIPNGTTIPAFGFIAFDEDDFHPGRTTGFGLDKAGELVVLSAPGRVVDAIRFQGQENGASLGRYPDGAPHWLATLPTPGQTNQPVTATLQISELMYHPLFPAGNEMEYIQIKNVGVSTVAFSNPTGSYRIDGGVTYTFPVGTSLAPEEKLWLVSFDPAVESALLAQFRSTYGLGVSDPVCGPYKGELSNRGERVALERPQDSDDPLQPFDVSWGIVDELFYFDQAPWPITADGEGNPLIRTGLTRWNVPFVPGIGVSESALFHLVGSDRTPPDDSIEIWNSGLSTLNYSISTDVPWLSASPASGTSTGEHTSVTLEYDTAGMVAGTYTGRVEITSTNAYNSPRGVEVLLEVYEPELDHLSWMPIGTNQYVNQPFNASLTAFDQHGSILSAFNNSVSISAQGGGGVFAPDVQIGSGTVPWEYPMATFYHDSRTQAIYLKSEIGAACSLTSLALNVSTIPPQMLGNWTIRLRHTALDRYDSSPTWENTWTTVYQNNEIISATGWVVFEFNTPFEYDGTNHLMVDFSHNNSSYTTDGFCLSTGMTTSRALYYRTDSGYADPLDWSGSESPTPNLSTAVPNIKLGRIVDNSVSILPTATGSFVQGIWSGSLTVLEPMTNLVLIVDNGAGHAAESNPFNVAPDPDDLDGDGISDLWEVTFFSDPSNCVASSDADHDGQSNLQEYIAGMDPTNAASRFAAELDTQLADGFVVHWNAVTGRVYDVLWAPDLMRGFQMLKPAIPYPVNNYTDRVHSAASSGYYLVTVHLPSGIDSDGDGLPDYWESQFFNNPTFALAGHDADSDGQSNVEEYLAGTNPTNAVSRFKIDILNANVIHWTPQAGRTYSVFWTDDLAKPLKRIASGLSSGSYTDSQHAGSTANYYYITVEME